MSYLSYDSYHPECIHLKLTKLVIRVWLDFSLQYELFLVCKSIEMWILLNMVIPKAMSFPKKVCVLLHHDQGSIFALLDKHCPDLHQVLPQAYAYKYSWELCKTWCYGLLCEVPNHHLHSNIQNFKNCCYIGKIELKEKGR